MIVDGTTACSSRAISSLVDFRHFHRMLCHPFTAHKCIQTFNGVVLFLPQLPGNGDNEDLSQYDATRPILNILSYYALVVVSFTGLWSLLGRTKCLVSREYDCEQPLPLLQAEASNKFLQGEELVDLKISQNALLKYLHSVDPDTTKDLRLLRRFEFDFTGLLTVIMLHLQSNDGATIHLVEVYELSNHFPSRLVVAKAISWLGKLARLLYAKP